MPTENQLLEALHAAVYTTDAEGRITFYNSAAARLWGYKPALGSMWCGSWRIYKPSGERLPHDQCPMAVALKEKRAVIGVDAVAERPDGTRVPFMPYPTPLFDEKGNLVGAINLLVDLSETHRIEEDRARLAAIVDSSEDAIIGKSLGGIVTSWNRGAEVILGFTPDQMIGQHITKVIPPELHAEEEEILERLSKGEPIKHYETKRLAKDGRVVDISLSVSPIRDIRGNIIGASSVARDISERKRAEEQKNLLVNELHHRVKNTLAIVDAIARQTLNRSSDPDRFAGSFLGRLKSLARSHSMLARTTFQRAEIDSLLRDQLMLGDGKDARIRLSGPSVILGAESAMHLGLVLHELGTNARKYGALAGSTGAIRLEWVLKSTPVPTLKLKWQESGGPLVRAPERPGFGTLLIEQSLRPHGGEAAIEYAPDGLKCEITLPLEEQVGMMEPAHEQSRRLAGSGARPKLSGKNILVVEDEMLIAMTSCDYLAEAGCRIVGPALTISAALDLVATEDIDAALLDGNLDGKPIDEIASQLTRRGIPFAFVTGYLRDALPEPFRNKLTVEKPFSQDQLLSAVESLLGEPSGETVINLRSRR